MEYFFVSISILLNILFNSRLEYKENFIKNAQKTQAIISDIKYKSMINEEIEKVYVKYFVNNKEFIGTLTETSSSMYEGKSIEIYYDIENPNKIILGINFTDYLFKAFTFFMMFIGIISIIYSINRLILYIYTLKGREVEAKIERVIEKQCLGYKSYIIECKWIAKNGIEYTFHSSKYNETYFMDVFNKLNISKLKVRINETNKKKYIVLTDRIDKELMK